MVSYVNTTAEVKAQTDICCTSSNAVDVVASIPADTPVLFGPDQFLGAHVRRILGRDNISVWGGECHVHAGINGSQLTAQAKAHPDADLYIHPECGCATSALYLASAGAVPADRVKILSTGEMVDAARRTAPRQVLVATEIGMLHQLRRAAPGVDFRAVNERASCRYMKMITPAKLLTSLRELRDEVVVDPEIAAPGARRGRTDDRDRAERRRRMTRPASVSSLGTVAGALLPRWEASADVVVVGTGVAGLTAALTTAAAGLSVLLITKGPPTRPAPSGPRAASRWSATSATPVTRSRPTSMTPWSPAPGWPIPSPSN